VHVTVCAVGRMRGPGWTALQDDYLQRIRHYARCDMVEYADDNELSRRWPNRDTVVALDVEGQAFRSTQFAQMVQRWSLQGKGEVAFVIGGADGIPPQCLKRVQFRLSLSAMTLPHRLARIVLLEQLYRAFTILRGEPYARES
jgi:23S rRNA (pseudouridine1915-N3)-methyltransferase